MDECPACHETLHQVRLPHGNMHVCPRCGGRSVTLPVLRRLGADRDLLADVWQGSRHAGLPQPRRCPHCRGRMPRVRARIDHHTAALDVCRRCMAVWFDPAEFQAMPAPAPDVRSEYGSLSPEARQKLAVLKVQQMQDQYEQEGEPLEPRHVVHAVLGVPAELGEPPRRGRPWMTWGVIAACTLFTLVMLTSAAAWEGRAAVLGRWGFVPAEWYRDGGLTAITSFFLHVGWLHLFGNMAFLWIFADNVEDRLGWARLVVLLAAAHGIGLIVHGAFAPDPHIALVGASAGVSGVVAFYGAVFPHVGLGIPLRFGVHVRFIRMPAAAALGLYVLLQLGGAWFQVSGFRGPSYLAHLGGLAVGLAAALHFRVLQTRRSARALA